MRGLAIFILLSAALAAFLVWHFWNASSGIFGLDLRSPKSVPQTAVAVPPRQASDAPAQQSTAEEPALPAGETEGRNDDSMPPEKVADPASVSDLKRILEKDPYNEGALREALDRAREAGAWHDIAEASERLLVLSPQSHALRAERAAALLRLGRIAEAMHELRTLSELRPDDADVWFNFATACELAGERSDALAAWTRAVELSPADTELRRRRALLCWQMRAWSSAITDFEAVAATQPLDTHAAIALSQCYAESDDWLRAEQTLERAQEQRPRDVRLWNRRGELAWRNYLRSDDAESRSRAIRAWEQSLEIAPGQAEVREQLQVARSE